ncbi:branched-chain amino acid ABC transporter permease [uncultured Dysosmobacter sp.]|uniref:branched-chain amino acid ABC transporter permease n=1 Tax=uncultured Dysosmobacter sp. TaxID=2591384 RepID=UPI002601CDA8|nr:branched-chain amino acid ABC transporter permease [uncultured Dysosmobacter sp.]
MLSYWTGVATLTGIYLIATLGVSILVGFTGLFSLGHAGFMAIGAYGTALAVKMLHLPFYAAILVGILASMLAGALIGKATLRLKGDYFVIATLAIGECTKLLIENIPSITGGARGLADIPRKTNFFVVWTILVIVVVLLHRFLNAKHGRGCVAVREEELAAKSIGIDTTRTKMLSLLISCALCGMAGGLLAGYMGYLYPIMFTMAKSNELTMTVILGGAGSLTGTILAGLVLIPLPEYLRIESAEEWRMVLYGVLVVIVVVFKPSGLMGNKEFTVSGLLRRLKKWFSKEKRNGEKGAGERG